MELIKEHNWPNEPRLKMIEKSELYYGSEKVYQYGFYDGYQYQNKEIINLQKKIIELELLLSKANIDSSPLKLDRAITQNPCYVPFLFRLWNKKRNLQEN